MRSLLVLAACTALTLLGQGATLEGLAASTQPAAPTAPDPALYKHVSHLGWVVRDVEQTVAAWRALGVKDIGKVEVRALPRLTYRGRTVTARVKTAIARFDNGAIEWLQPLGDGSAYADFLARRGEGVQHVAFSVPTEARLTAEVARYQALGIGVLQQRTWTGRAGTGRAAQLDTAAAAGGMTIALEHDPDATPAPGPSSNDAPFTRITQYAFVVRDVKAVSAFHERIGLGALPVERNVSLDRVYRGAPGAFEMLLGWGRQGDVVFEWIQSTIGPNVYDEHLRDRGEGFHHLGFNVADMDAALAGLRERGLSVTMSGGWNVNGHEGRFAYLDADRHGGVTIELLWNKPR